MEPVWLRLAGRLSIQTDQPRFGFSWRIAVLLRKPQVFGVVFPWISLDSLVRIETYQWVTRKNLRKIFPRAFVVAKDPSTAAHDLGMAKGRIAHGASLTKFLIFCKRLSPGPFGLGASLQSKLALIRD
jgi:hypothetical protein